MIQQENRSFDSYFGTYPGADGLPMQNGVPTVCVNDPQSGSCVQPFVDHKDINGGGPHSQPNATVIDANDGSIVGTIDLGGAPEQAASDGQGHLYVDIEDKDNVAVVDANALKGATIGVARDQGFGISEKTDAIMDTAIAAIKHAGATTVDVNITELESKTTNDSGC